MQGKNKSLVSIETIQGICLLPLNPGRLEADSKCSATLRLTLVMICSSSSFPLWVSNISHKACMNQEPQDVFLQE